MFAAIVFRTVGSWCFAARMLEALLVCSEYQSLVQGTKRVEHVVGLRSAMLAEPEWFAARMLVEQANATEFENHVQVRLLSRRRFELVRGRNVPAH